MFSKIAVYLQYLLPKKLLTIIAGFLANSQKIWLKNNLIKFFIKRYKVDLTEAIIEDPYAYPTFNSFFIRKLKPELRPIAGGPLDMICPVDGAISQIGYIQQKRLLQVKNFYFNLETLLGNDQEVAENYIGGSFATFYLAPKNYHRVHMPISGKLIKSIYVPGKLFSVNKMTSELIPHLYSRNERFITIFETDRGLITVILVAAMLVGTIQTVWLNEPVRATILTTNTYDHPIQLTKGSELGYFKLGSTVILLAEKNQIKWLPSLNPNNEIKFGQLLTL